MKLKKLYDSLMVVVMMIVMICPSAVLAYDLPSDGKYVTPEMACISEKMIVADCTTGALSEGTYQKAGSMGDGLSTLDTYRIVDMSAHEDNATNRSFALLEFDITKIQDEKVYNAAININTKIVGVHNGTFYVYSADELGNVSEILDNNDDIDDIFSKISEVPVGKFKRSFSEYSKGTWISVDISTYIRYRARNGCDTATVILRYVPDKMNSVYWMGISAMNTSYAPCLTANIPQKENISKNLERESHLNPSADLTTGALTVPESETSVSNMNNSSNLSCYRLTNAGSDAEASSYRLFLQYDISDYLYDEISSASFDFRAKFVGNNAGTLKLYSADDLNVSDMSVLTDEYDNISAIKEKITEADLVATFSRAAKAYTTGTDLEMDVTGYIRNSIESGKTKVSFMIEFLPSSTNTAYVLYIASYDSGFGPSLNFNLNENPNKSIVYDEEEKTVKIRIKTYEGTEATPYSVRLFAGVFSGNALKDTFVSGTYSLDGSGTLVSESFPVDDYENKNIKIFLWNEKLAPHYKDELETFFDDAEGVFPSRIYTVTNDSGSDRSYALNTYVDYMYNEDTNILFKEENTVSDNFAFPVISKEQQGSAVSKDYTTTLPLYSDKYLINKKTVTQTNTLMSKEQSSPIRILCLGDSVTAGYGTDVKYWQYLQELFWKESIDFNDSSRKIMTVGTNYIGKNYKNNQRELTYKGITETLKGYGEGRGGWMISNFLYHDKNYSYGEETYVALGGTEAYTDSDEQRDYIHSNTLAVASDAEQPDNVFYDGEKEGKVKFSIDKWLERYRTHDSDGNPLELGNGTGTCITENNISEYAVCEPTHVLLQFGHNDFRFYSEEQFRTNLWMLVSEIKKDLPDAAVIISMTPPSLGTYNGEFYDGYTGTAPAGDAWYRNAEYLNEFFSKYNEKANKVYLLPTYFVTPTAEAYDSDITMPDLHPTEKAHEKWAYQLYALLKYMQ